LNTAKTQTSLTNVDAHAANRPLAALMAAALGLVIVFGASFAPSETVHNAAHDTRHVFAMPCH
jgi:cobalt transporter subunit CbtB